MKWNGVLSLHGYKAYNFGNGSGQRRNGLIWSKPNGHGNGSYVRFESFWGLDRS